MGLAITSLGITVKYAAETTSGTRPATGYTLIPDIKSLPDFNPEPDTIETTTFANTEYKTYVNGLKDLGGTLAFTANLTNELYEAWEGEDGVMQEYETATAAGKSLWLLIDIPNFEKGIYFPFEPASLGISAVETNSLVETEVHITPIGEVVYETKPSV